MKGAVNKNPPNWKGQRQVARTKRSQNQVREILDPLSRMSIHLLVKVPALSRALFPQDGESESSRCHC